MESLDERQKAAVELFKSLEDKYPEEVGRDKAFLTFIGALVGAGEPNQVATLYLYLCSKPEYQTPDQRKALVRRMRESLMKCVPLNGVPAVLEAVFSIAKVERDEDKDYSFSREDWKSGPENYERGQAWLKHLYQGNLDAVQSNFAGHKDFWWLSIEITYGLFLSDHTILSGLESELTVMSAIMSQNYPNETAWHLRATRRVGVSMEGVELLQQTVEAIAEWCGRKLDRICRVKDIEHEV